MSKRHIKSTCQVFWRWKVRSGRFCKKIGWIIVLTSSVSQVHNICSYLWNRTSFWFIFSKKLFAIYSRFQINFGKDIGCPASRIKRASQCCTVHQKIPFWIESRFQLFKAFMKKNISPYTRGYSNSTRQFFGNFWPNNNPPHPHLTFCFFYQDGQFNWTHSRKTRLSSVPRSSPTSSPTWTRKPRDVLFLPVTSTQWRRSGNYSFGRTFNS